VAGSGMKNIRGAFPIIILLGIFMMFGCSEPKDMNRIENILLRDGDTTATLALPAAYGAKAFSSSGAKFLCQYPSMQPVVNEMDVSSMTVAVLLGHFRKNLYELMMDEAQSDHFDPKRLGAAYRAGTKGEYKVFLRGNPVSDPNFDTYYLFKARDGQWVQADRSDWGAIYTIERQMNPDVSIKYWFMKSQGTDFVHIDEVVTEFIKTHLKTQYVNRQGKQ
jgi:hypothetical protein